QAVSPEENAEATPRHSSHRRALAMDASLSRLTKKRWFDEVAGILLLAATAISLLAIISYERSDPSWFHRQAAPKPVQNWIGPVGANAGELLLQLLGAATFVVPVLLALS